MVQKVHRAHRVGQGKARNRIRIVMEHCRHRLGPTWSLTMKSSNGQRRTTHVCVDGAHLDIPFDLTTGEIKRFITVSLRMAV